jgi:hypothetical protein
VPLAQRVQPWPSWKKPSRPGLLSRERFCRSRIECVSAVPQKSGLGSECRQAVRAFSEVNWAACHQHPNARRKPDHAAAFNTLTTATSRSRSLAAVTWITAPPTDTSSPPPPPSAR